MKTTLKRGIGRGAAVNGNGRAVIPPGTLSPVTLYRQPPPSRPGVAKTIGKFFLWLIVLLLIVVAGLVGGFYLWAHESAKALGCSSITCKRAQPSLATIPDAHHPTVALVVGYDHRAGDGNSPSRSDTMMLIRADPTTKTISLLSFPRDLVVPIYCPSKTHTGPPSSYGTGRINSAYAFCGASGALETVKHLTGVPVNYLISVNFLGFIAVVNKLGGIWMDVDRRYYNKNVGTQLTDYANIDLQPGYQLMDGKHALQFVRFRHTDSDLYRLARQQEFVSAMRQRVADSLGPQSLVGIVNTIADHHYIEIGVGGGGHLDLNTILRYASFAYHLPHGRVFQTKIDNLTVGNEVYAPQSSISAAVQSFLSPDVEAPATQTAVALGRKIHHKFTLPPSQVSLTVLNGNGIAGSAANASYLLGQKGYRIILPPTNQPANAPSWNYFHSKVYFDPRRAANGRSSAQRIARLVGSADVAPMPPKIATLSNGALTVLVVGSTFHDQLTPIVLPTMPVRQPPNIRVDPGETRPSLFRLKKRMPFRLQLPTVLERNSYFDSGLGETPVRVYQLGGSPTVRLTYRMGANEYWGIQESPWVDAPILADKSLTQWVGGRRYDLYYSGSQLHMVVLRTGGASYWVVNSLLNALSNETMLAIARGLRPMTR
ncbi:MAG TPA: LCP family protein [Gaiellaceae bacterium]|nr:LCP family protein [Gaiellaceae bacterium]